MVPAVVHGRQQQPLIAQQLHQAGHQVLHRAWWPEGWLGMPGFECIDDVGAVLQPFAFGRVHHGNHREADVGNNDLLVDGPVGAHFFEGQALPAQVGAHLGAEVADFGAVQAQGGWMRVHFGH